MAAPALVQLESNALDWLRDWMGFPETTRGLFTTGGSMATFNALLCAREKHLGTAIREGVVYTSDQAHHCVLKSAKLAGILPDRVRGHLPRQDDHRDGVHVRGGDAGDRVGHARTAGDQAYAHLLGGARVGIGGMHRGLLMANQDVLELFLLEDGVVDIENRATGIAKDMLDTFFLKASNDDFCTREFHERVPFKIQGARPPAPTRKPMAVASTQTLERDLRG